MTNSEHLDILKQGVDVWNQWRKVHPDIQPDLNEAYLQDTDLSRINLGKTLLRNAHMQRTNLTEADLSEAHLEGTDLFRAHLEGAYLRDAHLEGANLYETHLEGAYLLRVFFDHATRLNGISLADKQYGPALLAEINWGGTNLFVVDWESVKMLGDEHQAHQPKYSDEEMKDEVKNKARRVLEYRWAVRANRQLAAVLRDQGLNEEADSFAYRAQRLRRIVWRRQTLLPQQKFWQRIRRLGSYLLSIFLDLLSGYGYKPSRSIIAYLLVIFAFALAYYVFGHLPLFPDSLIFSLTSFHGRGFFPSLSGETNLHNPLVVLAAFEAIVGLFIEISFIATFTQRFFGR